MSALFAVSLPLLQGSKNQINVVFCRDVASGLADRLYRTQSYQLCLSILQLDSLEQGVCSLQLLPTSEGPACPISSLGVYIYASIFRVFSCTLSSRK